MGSHAMKDELESLLEQIKLLEKRILLGLQPRRPRSSTKCEREKCIHRRAARAGHQAVDQELRPLYS